MSQQDDKWTSIANAFHRAQALYLQSNAPDNEIRGRATDYLIRRLASGMIRARARFYEFDIDYFMGPHEISNRESIPLEANGTIPIRFWLLALDCRRHKSGSSDWHELDVGDMYFKWHDGASEGEGAAHGVQVLVDDLATMDLPSLESSLLKDAQVSLQTGDKKKGRGPAHWWPDFAEELALYIHENGIPDGSEREGQTKICTAIGDILEVRGISISASTVKPVIGNVLKRLRSSGK